MLNLDNFTLKDAAQIDCSGSTPVNTRSGPWSGQGP